AWKPCAEIYRRGRGDRDRAWHCRGRRGDYGRLVAEGVIRPIVRWAVDRPVPHGHGVLCALGLHALYFKSGPKPDEPVADGKPIATNPGAIRTCVKRRRARAPGEEPNESNDGHDNASH